MRNICKTLNASQCTKNIGRRLKKRFSNFKHTFLVNRSQNKNYFDIAQKCRRNNGKFYLFVDWTSTIQTVTDQTMCTLYIPTRNVPINLNSITPTYQNVSQSPWVRYDVYTMSQCSYMNTHVHISLNTHHARIRF